MTRLPSHSNDACAYDRSATLLRRPPYPAAAA
eukprot:CAMPEP_0183361690 /NCGR_PEP_ID=MMETSP0164_2-20130417/63300_1 /TAXON_ID=221442 /ORGANISM="Coccolithus pelagicus ssp braarudi, Strain PLY182g" /LENGTH=31 /DNA_ID= /DNA_START= /DNA_END= /DNA_ORIENTATION=